MKREDFIQEYERIARDAYEIARLQSEADYNEYPFPEIASPVITSEGAVFYGMRPDPYDDGVEFVENVVTWEAMDDTKAAIKWIKKVVSDKKRAAEEQGREWRRNMYEQMKKEFEK